MGTNDPKPPPNESPVKHVRNFVSMLYVTFGRKWARHALTSNAKIKCAKKQDH